MVNVALTLLIMAICLAAEAFFSGSEIGELPGVGQSIVAGGYVFEVVSVARQRISKLKAMPVDSLTSQEFEAAGASTETSAVAGIERGDLETDRTPTGD